MTIEQVTEYLKHYDGPDVRIMEVCGSHTAAIAKCGIAGMISPKIHLLSGPGCPVCVTPSAYVDRLIKFAEEPGNCVATFGDLIRVPGSAESLSMAKGKGARVKMVYGPDDIISCAREDPSTTWIFAAVGFETTAPVYALLADRIVKEQIRNVRLLTAIKTMPPVIRYLLSNGAPIDAFLAPGHVAAVTGSKAFVPVAEDYGIPFTVSGFSGKQILISLYDLVKKLENPEKCRAQGIPLVTNCYPSVVTEEGNTKAQALIAKYFEPGDAVWRGMGSIPDSGLYLRKEYASLDAGSRGLDTDEKKNRACRCGEVLMGKIVPSECPLYGKICTPLTPEGACMVSSEGSCNSWFRNGLR